MLYNTNTAHPTANCGVEGTASMQVAWRHCAHLHTVQRVSLLAVQTARQSAVLSERASEMAQALVGDMPWAWGSWTAWAWEVVATTVKQMLSERSMDGVSHQMLIYRLDPKHTSTHTKRQSTPYRHTTRNCDCDGRYDHSRNPIVHTSVPSAAALDEWMHAKSPDLEQREGTFVYVYTASFRSPAGSWW